MATTQKTVADSCVDLQAVTPRNSPPQSPITAPPWTLERTLNDYEPPPTPPSVKTKFPRATALPIAEELQAMIAPACTRIAIAGSLRRGKAEVGDIEILYVPKLTERADGLFDRKIVDVAGEVIDGLAQRGLLAKRLNVRQQFTWGERNKLAIHVPSGIPVDLFGTSEENWWVSLVIRTGSKETNLRLTTGANRQNATLNAYGCGVTWSDGTITPATSERHVFELCRVPYLEPHER